MARILITGATGYIGSRIARRITADGHEVHALLRNDSDPARLEQVVPPSRQHRGDGDLDGMLSLFECYRFDGVVHVAARFLATHTPDQVEDLYRSNFLLGALLLEASARNGVRLFINTGSSWQNFRSNQGLPVCLYAAQKNAVDEIARFYTDAFKLTVVDLLLFDTYGPGDDRPKLLNSLFDLAKNGGTLALSPGAQRLDLVFIDDVVAAFSLVVSRGLAGAWGVERRFMVRSGRTVSLRELVAMVEVVSGRALDIAWGARDYREREVMEPWAGGVTLPGWQAEVRVEEGVARTWSALVQKPPCRISC